MNDQGIRNSTQWYTQDPWKAYMSWFSPRWAQPIEDFDPAEWVEKLKRGNFRIAVLHCKHHDGICFFKSRFRDKQPARYTSTHTHTHCEGCMRVRRDLTFSSEQ